PGVTNVMTPVAGAWIDSVPMIVVSGQVKRADLMSDSGVRQMGPQEVDTESLVDPITKYSVTVMDASKIRYHLERALFEATTGRPGPVWIDVPLDIQGAEVDPASLKGFDRPADTTTVSPDVIESLVAAVGEAERPLLFAGHGVRLAGVADEFQALVEKLGIPVVATWNAMDLLPWDHPLYVGKPGSVAMRGPNFAVQNCDLLIGLGTRLDNVVTAFNPKGFGRVAKKIIIDVDPAELKKNEDAIDLAICADLKALVPAWLERATTTPDNNMQVWRDRCQDWKNRYQVDDFGGNEKISHYDFVSALSDAVPEDTLVTTGSSGLGVEVFYSAYRNKKGQRIFLTSGLGAMGYGLPAAIGACFAGGCLPMVAVESDGSLQLNLQELNTLKGNDLPIRLFVLNNAGYGSIRTTQRNYFEGRYVGTGPEAGLYLPDMEKVAASYDLPFVRIENSTEMRGQIGEVLAQRGPLICEVMLQENEGLRPKVSAIPQPDGSMISMPLEDMAPLLSLDEMRAEMGDNLSDESLKVQRDD
ncbi:MAG: thiamine pyrophosphate-binding protein, partial [Gammaproteobacteria bacterium]|nr:thiamine pyrophosphate-binding protein [Gammaproteobacteria bacterium]